MTREDSESEDESPQFSHYEPNVLRMMENMGYDLTNGPWFELWQRKENVASILRSKREDP